MDNNNQPFADFMSAQNLGDTNMLRQIWQWISQQFSGKIPNNLPLNLDNSLSYWQDSLQKITSETALRDFIAQNPSLRPEIVGEIARFIKDTTEKERLNQDKKLIEEECAFEEFSKLNTDIFGANYANYFETIQRFYPEKEDFSLDFYAIRLQSLHNLATSDEKQAEKINDLHQHICQEWEMRLQTRQFAAQLDWISQQRERFLFNLYDKIEKYEALQKTLNPLGLSNEFGRLWDMSKGNWVRTSTKILEKYADMLRRNPQLQQIATLLGKLRASEQEYEEELLTIQTKKKNIHYHHAQKEEFIGIKLSDEIAHAMPSELALLADTNTEAIFIKRWAEKKLQTWQYQAKYLTETQESSFIRQRRPKPTNKGAIILCIDTSGSMHGQPEQIAKALSFAILKTALKENRDCFLISFSTGIKTLDLTTVSQSLPALIDFLNMSFDGGTDATPALSAALQQLNQKNYQKSDVIMISDFVMSSLPDDLGKKMEVAKRNLQTKFFSLSISQDQNTDVLNYFDYNWVYNPKNPKNLIQLIQTLTYLKKD